MQPGYHMSDARMTILYDIEFSLRPEIDVTTKPLI